MLLVLQALDDGSLAVELVNDLMIVQLRENSDDEMPAVEFERILLQLVRLAILLSQHPIQFFTLHGPQVINLIRDLLAVHSLYSYVHPVWLEGQVLG